MFSPFSFCSFFSFYSFLPWWGPLLLLYVFIGAMVGLKPRIAWLPISFIIPILFYLMQARSIMAMPHEWQLYLLLAFLGGLLVGGTVARPRIGRVFLGMRFEVSGEWTTLLLFLAVFCAKSVAGYVAVQYPESSTPFQLAGALIGIFVPSAFLGRALYSATHLRRSGYLTR